MQKNGYFFFYQKSIHINNDSFKSNTKKNYHVINRDYKESR